MIAARLPRLGRAVGGLSGAVGAGNPGPGQAKGVCARLCGRVCLAENECRREVDGVAVGVGGLCLLGLDAGERLGSSVALIVKDSGADGLGLRVGSKSPFENAYS